MHPLVHSKEESSKMKCLRGLLWDTSILWCTFDTQSVHNWETLSAGWTLQKGSIVENEVQLTYSVEMRWRMPAVFTWYRNFQPRSCSLKRWKTFSCSNDEEWWISACKLERVVNGREALVQGPKSVDLDAGQRAQTMDSAGRYMTYMMPKALNTCIIINSRYLKRVTCFELQRYRTCTWGLLCVFDTVPDTMTRIFRVKSPKSVLTPVVQLKNRNVVAIEDLIDVPADHVAPNFQNQAVVLGRMQ